MKCGICISSWAFMDNDEKPVHEYDLKDAKKIASDGGFDRMIIWNPRNFAYSDLDGNRVANDMVNPVIVSQGEVGQHISKAAADLVQIAIDFGSDTAALKFNDRLIEVSSGSMDKSEWAAKFANEYTKACDLGRKEWEASPEGRKYATEQEAQTKAAAAKAKALEFDIIEELSGCEGRPTSKLLRSVGDWVELDGGNRQVQKICHLLIASGFESGAFVGHPSVADKSNMDLFSRYCMGQVVDMGLNSGAIHPLIGSWLKEAAGSSAIRNMDASSQVYKEIIDEITPAKNGKTLRA